MKKLLATISIITALGIGAFALNSVLPAGAVGGSVVQAADPSSSSSSSPTPACPAPRAQVFKGVLDKLVTDGTITQDQETAIISALQDARQSAPANGKGAQAAGPRVKVLAGMLDVAAGKVNMSAADLRAAIKSGKSVADIATANGVNPSDVVTAIVDAGKTKLGQAVTDGKLTQAQADKLTSRLPELADKFVNHTPKSC